MASNATPMTVTGPDGHRSSAAPSRGTQASLSRPSTVKVRARGEEFRIVQLCGQLLVCSRQHGSCCCGWEEKGRLPFDPDRLWGDEWERRKVRNRVHLTFTGCLGPCAAGNSAILLLYGRAIAFKDLNQPAVVPRIFDWIDIMLAEERIVPPPSALQDHIYERFLPPPSGEQIALVAATDPDQGGLERLDPVCLMDVDPTTARHTVEYEGRTIAFCAPSCKRQFLANPAAYLVS